MSESNNQEHNKDDHGKKVVVKVDRVEHKVEAGEYTVSKFKVIVGVPADYDLDELINGKFEPLLDTATIKIKGGEIFVSHVRTGGSSK